MSRTTLAILIVTHTNDLHSLLVQEELENRYDVRCHILEIDRLSEGADLSWTVDDSISPSIRDRRGDLIDIRAIDTIWWRRFRSSHFQIPDLTDPAAADLMMKDSRASVEGLLLNSFRGVWVSHPHATRLAENKLTQLRAAQRAGFRIPRTLVSQDPSKIRQFCAELKNDVIIKAVRGTNLAPTLTMPITEELLGSDSDLRMCPAIFQERIDGTRHVRANYFGDNLYAVLIEANELDWRRDLTVPMRPTTLDNDVTTRLGALLEDLKLRMGIFDLKFSSSGELVWLEINPQGQFLFLQPIVQIDLASAMASFLYKEAQRVQHG